MKHCTQCGHVLGLGRFCTNCGHPVAARHADPLSDPIDAGQTEHQPASGPEPEPDRAEEWRTDTAERPVHRTVPDPVRVPAPPAAPRLPPAAGEAPPPPRFPLFADELSTEPVAPSDGPAAPVTAPVTPPVTPPDAGADDRQLVEGDELGDVQEDEDWEDWDDWEDDRRPRALWVVGGVVLLASLILGAWLLGQALGGDDQPPGEPAAEDTTAPDQSPVDHTAQATARAPSTAPSTEDVDGNPTSYEAANMLDGVPDTAWRATGDGKGLKLVFTFPDKTRISEVGLVNGYAKTATDDSGATFDWYAGHRRITQVTWNLGFGDVVRQDLEEVRELQTVEVGPVEVRRIVLKIVATTPPGQGPTRRDFTAISDVFLAG